MNDLELVREGKGYRIFLSKKANLFYSLKDGETTWNGPFISDYHAAEDFHINTPKVIPLDNYSDNVINVNFVTKRRV